MSVYAEPPQVSRRAVVAWREQAISTLASKLGKGVARKTQARMETSLRRIAGLLHHAYGTPHLGNLEDPTAEFIYIVLSRKTREDAYKAAFERLRTLGSWAAVAALPTDRLADLLRGGGLEQKKVTALRQGLLEIERRFGSVDLSKARDMEDEALLAFLSGLPELGPKSARCIMLYAFGRAVFPVDAHVGRVLVRLGVLMPLVGDMSKTDHKQRQALMADAVPPDLRYGLHVNLIAHGRSICLAVHPRCSDCPLLRSCAYGRRTLDELRRYGSARRAAAEGRIGGKRDRFLE